MRKLVLLLFTVSLLFSSCSQKNLMTVKGVNIFKELEGTTIYMQIYNHDWTAGINIDSAIVKNGEVVFQRIIDDNPRLLALVVEGYYKDEKVKLNPVNFMSDVGDIVIDYTAFFPTIGGTALNIDFQEFKNTQNDYNRLLPELKAKSDSVPSSLQKYEDTYREYLEKAMPFLEENIKSDGVVALLPVESYVLENKDLLALLDSVPAHLLEKKTIKELQTRALAIEATLEGKVFTDISGKDINGNPISLSDVASKGKYILVDFWASWCGPCIAEMPRMKKIHNKYKHKGFEIFGVSIDNNTESWLEASKKHGVVWNQMIDNKGWESEAILKYGVGTIPFTLLIDKDGTIIANNLQGEKLEAKLEELFK